MADLRRRLVAEALGTFGLVLVGPGAVMVDARTGGMLGVAGIAAAFGLIVFLMVTAFGRISGAHLNPAVTLALWRLNRFAGGDVPPYILAQSLGAILAGVALRCGLGDVAALGATIPSLSLGPSFVVEWLLSAILMFVVLGAAADPAAPHGMAPLAIGLAVGCCALVGGPLTGASMNPARSLGPAIIGGTWSAHWLYWVAPISGTMAAAGLYGWLVPSVRVPRHVATNSNPGTV